MYRHRQSGPKSVAIFAIIITFIFDLCILAILSYPAHAETNSGSSSALNGGHGVYLKDIHTVPETIHVGDTFKINATVVNNSTNTIIFAQACGPVTNATFDRGVVKENATVCNILILPENLPPGHKITIQIPDPLGGVFKATKAGIVHSELMFPYRIQREFPHILNATALFNFHIDSKM